MINHDGELLAGERRLSAVTHLGWDKVDAVVMNPDNPVAIEWSENECRKDFTTSERVRILMRCRR